MIITEVLQLVDRLVEKQTGKHLDDLEKSVVKGLWEGKTYSKIAEESGYKNSNYIGDVSRKLYKILSAQLEGENVNKYNFCWTIERVISSPQFVGLINTEITWCSNNRQLTEAEPVDHEEKKTENTTYQDLTLAPKIINFYSRETEIQTLSNWLTNQNIRLISVLGISGIGKSTLVRHFIYLNQHLFDIILWKSIKISPFLYQAIAEILTNIKVYQSITIKTENQLTEFFNLLQQKRCLIILDDVQELFIRGEFAGQYQQQYQNYKHFFQKLVEIEHQSSLILISQEKCQEMLCLDEELYPIKCLELSGIENINLKKYGLQNEESWSKLINLYEGNPVYLESIVGVIKDMFRGNVSNFLTEEGLLLIEEIRLKVAERFSRLSPIEQEIIREISKHNEPVSREYLKQSLSLSSIDLINGLRSLARRYLLQKTETNEILFNLSPIVREYAIKFLVS
ncbi:NB-ARC domain-containing protein [Okeania sp. SIO2B3]|uniref:NB-ARC domain-containing protein n=1 Tax=Okeania sp. SIO2B3 TaxID=2607784 RepID=UPI0013C1827A|nr:NB-ARC domain-containing protein [Okeania sp. SIO2B3]NET42196.1 ATP-binding protein [Okeania sp. SIO2B3]